MDRRPSSPNFRGRSSSPRPPPSYARSSLDRSPATSHMVLDERPRVPPPLYLRSSSPQPQSNKGQLKIHVPSWGVALVRPPRPLELHALESGGTEHEPPTEDTLLSGTLEVVMKEPRRVQAISVGVQSVCRLYFGPMGWEEDGIFERGVEVLSGDAEGIWLEKGSQSFSFSILLPATLATTDFHQFGFLSYILTAQVKGIPASTSFSSIFRPSTTSSVPDPDMPLLETFERVTARSDRIAAANAANAAEGTIAKGLSRVRSGSGSARESPPAIQHPSGGLGLGGLSLEDGSPDDASAIAVGEGNPSTAGLYTRRQSNVGSSSPLALPANLLASSPTMEGRTLPGHRPDLNASPSNRSEKTGWLKGDLNAAKGLMVHANPSLNGGVNQLDLRKEGFVEGLGSWRFTATADVFSISAVMLLVLTIPTPSPKCTIFAARLTLSQTYLVTSPRRPNNAPHRPEGPKQHVLYHIGKPHKAGERFPGRNLEALWRGKEAGGNDEQCPVAGWKTRAVARIPGHDKVRPTTNPGTVTPIRVSHEMLLHIFYSIDGQTVSGMPVDGPGELRMMTVKMPMVVPSCCNTLAAHDLPTYEAARTTCHPTANINEILSSPPSKHRCMCGSTFAELGEAALRRLDGSRAQQSDAAPSNNRSGGESGSGSGSGEGSSTRMSVSKEEEDRRQQHQDSGSS